MQLDDRKEFLTSEYWQVFDKWAYDIKPESYRLSWHIFDDIFSAYSNVVTNKYIEINHLISQWDCVLADLGGDPTHQDWNHFRPLRLSREEDWSDWLAFLIEKSETGVFAHQLHQIPPFKPSAYAFPRNVEREVSFKSHRADIIVQWRDGHYSHIEVKVGDQSLLKTYETSRMLRKKYGQPISRWSNFILLLSPQIPAWDEINNVDSIEPPVIALTWDVVSIALRRALRSVEKYLWKAWAYAFIGTIEQSLIGYPGHRLQDRPIEGIDTKIKILKGGLELE